MKGPRRCSAPRGLSGPRSAHGLKMIYSKFEVYWTKSLGGVESNAKCGKVKILAHQFKIDDFLFGLDHGCQRLFGVSEHILYVYQFSNTYSKKSGVFFVNCKGALLRQLLR